MPDKKEVEERNVFILADQDGRVSCKHGVLNPSQLNGILENIQFRRERGVPRIGSFGGLVEITGYNVRDDIKTRLIQEQYKEYQEAIERGQQATTDLSWMMRLTLYEDDNGRVGYLFTISRYYIDNFGRLNIGYEEVGQLKVRRFSKKEAFQRIKSKLKR